MTPVFAGFSTGCGAQMRGQWVTVNGARVAAILSAPATVYGWDGDDARKFIVVVHAAGYEFLNGYWPSAEEARQGIRGKLRSHFAPQSVAAVEPAGDLWGFPVVEHEAL